jgi:hypothetical protein
MIINLTLQSNARSMDYVQRVFGFVRIVIVGVRLEGG